MCSFGAFKQHVSIAFFNGAALKGAKRILQGDANRSMRSVKFRNVEEVDGRVLVPYVREAVERIAKGLKFS